MTVKHLKHPRGDAVQSLTPVLAAMDRGQNHALIGPVDGQIRECRCLLSHAQQRIDHRVASDHHTTNHTGGVQVGFRALRGSEMQLGNLGDQTAIGLFWEGV